MVATRIYVVVAQEELGVGDDNFLKTGRVDVNVQKVKVVVGECFAGVAKHEFHFAEVGPVAEAGLEE